MKNHQQSIRRFSFRRAFQALSLSALVFLQQPLHAQVTFSVYANSSTAAGYSGDGGPAISATLNNEWGLSINHNRGELYIADFANSAVRVINLGSSIINTYAGTGTAGFSGDLGPANAAQLNFPTGVTVDAAGYVYISDIYNYRVRIVDNVPSPTINTYAGNGTLGYAGDGLVANNPAVMVGMANGISASASGALLFPDYMVEVLRSVTPGSFATPGTIGSYAGPSSGYAGDGALVGPTTAFNTIVDVKHDWSTGSVYIADWGNNIVRKVDPTGTINVCAGVQGSFGSDDNMPATSAKINGPTAMDVDCFGNLYFCDANNHVVRKVNAATGIITTVAGTMGSAGSGTRPGQFNFPCGLVLDAIADLYISDRNNNRIVKLTFDATVCEGRTVALCDKTGTGTWSSSNTGVATVSSAGIVTGVATGSAIITLDLGTYQLYKNVTVTPPPGPISGPTSVTVGSTITLTDPLLGGTWSSSGTYATVDPVTGDVTGVAAGVETITYTMSEGCYEVYNVKVRGNCIDGSKLVITSTVDANGNCKFTAKASVSTGYTVAGYEWTLPTPPGPSVIVYTTATSNVQTFTLPGGGSFLVKVRIIVIRNDWESGESPCCETELEEKVSCQGKVPCDQMTPPIITAYDMMDANGACVPVYGSSVYPVTIGFSATVAGAPYWGCGPFTGSQALYGPTGADVISPCSVDPLSWNPASCWPSPGIPYPSCPLAPTDPTHINYMEATTVTYMGCTWKINVPIDPNCTHPAPGPRPGGAGGNIQANAKMASHLSVTPNPTDGMLLLEGNISAQEKNVRLEVMDMLGQVVYSDHAIITNGNISTKIMLGNNLANGMYVVKIKGDNTSESVRFTLKR